MFVSGTKDWPHDHRDDLKIPFNLTAESLRYRNADKTLTNNAALLYPDQNVTSLVSHSLGGSVVLEMRKKQYSDRIFKTTTCSAPTKSIIAPDDIDNKRFRNFGDAISILDRGATSGLNASLIKHSITHDDAITASTVAYQALDNHD